MSVAWLNILVRLSKYTHHASTHNTPPFFFSILQYSTPQYPHTLSHNTSWHHEQESDSSLSLAIYQYIGAGLPAFAYSNLHVYSYNSRYIPVCCWSSHIDKRLLASICKGSELVIHYHEKKFYFWSRQSITVTSQGHYRNSTRFLLIALKFVYNCPRGVNIFVFF